MPAKSDTHALNEMKKRTKRTLLQNHTVMLWLKNLAKAPRNVAFMKEKYFRRTGEIMADVQITEMFKKLDTDGSNAISMDEMQELFNENGLQMTVEEIAHMFSIVKKINEAEWLAKAGAVKQNSVPKKPYV